MPFLFTHICDLLSTLESLHISTKRKPALSPRELQTLYKSHITSWFGYFRSDLTPDLWLPLFSLLWPEGRSDRVYGFREDGLINAIGAAMCFGSSRVEELRKWRVGWDGKGDRDLGECVERVFAVTENVVTPVNAVTITEIEAVLDELASLCQFSSADIRNAKSQVAVNRGGTPSKSREIPRRQVLLGCIYLRLSSRDAKWFTRILLKSLLPVTLSPDNLFQEFHFLFPEIWRVRNDLKSALTLLSSKTFKLFPCHPDPEDKSELLESGCRLLLPEPGIKVGRPHFVKATSCKSVLSLVGKSTWALERKYDGEYCQIHVDLTKGSNWLNIYSKSGRDSTLDRVGCHGIIRDCLQLDSPEKRVVKKWCILEAEFLVYDEEEEKIANFCAIREHVTRAGRYIGTSSSGDRARGDKTKQHIILKFFDCILLDDICTPASSYNARRHHLENLIKKIPNKAELVTRKIIEFGRDGKGEEIFLESFARGIGMRWEGFVMKPVDGRYVGWGAGKGNFWIKVKKDYIEGFGDSGDFAIIGGRVGGKRGVERGCKLYLPNIGSVDLMELSAVDPGTANTFYAACLTNKQDLISLSAKPIFKVVFTVSYNLTQADISHLKTHRYFHGTEHSTESDMPYTILPLDSHFPKPDFLFSILPVVECFGGGFDKIDSSNYWTLRWPRVKKIHKDRDYLEALTFEELQKMAKDANTIPNNYTQDVRKWEEKLKVSTSRRRRGNAWSQGNKPTGMLTKSFWEADSPTTRSLKSGSWLAEASLEDPEATQEEEQESPLARHSERPLSQISGNSMTSFRESQSQYNPQRAITDSPIFGRQVYLMDCLSGKPEVDELLQELEISRSGDYKDLTVGIEEFPMSQEQRAVLLVEERRRDEIKCLLEQLSRATVERKTIIEVYSWRILKRMKALLEEEKGKAKGKRRRIEEDWSLMHLDTISSTRVK
ncbi:hypothetical protein ABW19_dt0209969 [Dactylella cylindrospora]|nr:hypothetical protein ABW19_dt0209969 [Dactylella cylindrospora]